MKSSTPYDDRSDLDKLHSQWNKISGIFEREKEWSAAIVRAATSAEIAANIAIRQRFSAESQLSSHFVDSLLVWANGIDGKFKRLIIPAEGNADAKAELRTLHKKAEKLNLKRNAIVHRGAFARKSEATAMVTLAHDVVMGLVAPWEPTFTLEKVSPLDKGKKKSTAKREQSR